MKIMRVKDHENLARYMLEEALEGAYITAVLFHDDAVCLMRELITYDEIAPASIEIHNYDYAHYGKEYYVSILGGERMELGVCPAFVDGKYVHDGAYIMLVDPEADSRTIPNLSDSVYMKLFIGEQEEECCGDCSIDCASDCSEEHGICSECMKKILEQDAAVMDYLHWRLFHM